MDCKLDLRLRGVTVPLWLRIRPEYDHLPSLGGALYRFAYADSDELRRLRFVQYDPNGNPRSETFGNLQANSRYEKALTLGTEPGIGALGFLLDRFAILGRGTDGEPGVRVHATGEPYWVFHDVCHALYDVRLAAYMDGTLEVHFPAPNAEQEDRANLEGAVKALAAGVPFAEIVAALVSIDAPFRERFKGAHSTALVDFCRTLEVKTTREPAPAPRPTVRPYTGPERFGKYVTLSERDGVYNVVRDPWHPTADGDLRRFTNLTEARRVAGLMERGL